MGALLSLPITLLNLLLPFTRPGTPLLQDLVHTAALCGSLYYAPQIAEWYHNHNHQQPTGAAEDDLTARNGTNTRQPDADTADRQDDIAEDDEDIPLDDRLVLQPDDEDAEPPPLAPTPPHAQNLAEPPLPQAIENDGFNNNGFNAQPGPANAPQGPRPTPANRTVGAKKAKSLARKDQRRAYHEFHRQGAEQRRLQEAEGKEEREAMAAAERERRAKVAEQISRKEKEEREARKREAERDAEMEQDRRTRVVERVRDEIARTGAVDMVDLAWTEGKDQVWVERLVRASGLHTQLQKDGQRVMTTDDGWFVRIDAEIMAQAYEEAERHGDANGGRVSFEQLGGFIKTAVLARGTQA